MVEALSFWLLAGFLQCSALFGKEAVMTYTSFFHGLRTRASSCMLQLVCEFLRTVAYGQAGVAAQLCPKCICAEAPQCLVLAWTARKAAS